MFKKLLGVSLFSAAICSLASAATIYVGPTDIYTTLNAGYNAAASGDQIVVRNGNVTTQGFTITKSVSFTTDGSVRTVNFSDINPIRVNCNDVSFSNLKFTGYNSTQAYIIYVSYNISYSMHDCEITGSAQKGIFDYGSINSTLESIKLNSTPTGFYGEDVRSMEMVGLNNVYSNSNVNIDSRRTIDVDIDYWIDNVSLTSGYASGAKCLNSVSTGTSNIPYYFIEGCTFTSVGPGAYPIYLDGYSTTGIMGNTFNYCPTVAWATVNGSSTVNESSNSFNSCTHP